MKFKINKNGYLEIFRKNSYKIQGCPYGVNRDCGDWCPLFCEPVSLSGEHNNPTFLKICNAEFDVFRWSEEMSDER